MTLLQLIFVVIYSVDTGSYVEQTNLELTILHLNLMIARIVNMPASSVSFGLFIDWLI